MSHEEFTTLAIGADPSRRLQLAKRFQPDVDLILSEGLNAFGVPGSGKSNLVSLLSEQLGRYLLPQLVIDTEGEYRRLTGALPHGIIATANRCPSGYDILHKGLQVVLDLSTWHTPEAAGLALVQLMDELFSVAIDMMQAREAVPCAIFLDEAATWVPQAQVDYLSKDTRRALYTVFQRLTNRGRKMGLVPLVFGQFISQINKDVIRRGGITVFMRQTLDIDLKRYAEYLPDFDAERKEAVRSFPTGKAAVLLPDGECPVVTFNRCKTDHASATPGVSAAIKRFAGAALDVSSLQMRPIGEQPAATCPVVPSADNPQIERPAQAVEPVSTWGQRIRYEREMRGWTQSELAAHLCTDAKRVGEWERGESAPSPVFRARLCQVLGKNAAELGLMSQQIAEGRQAMPCGKRIKYEREARGWSQRRLAGFIDATAKQVSSWECGDHMPSENYRERICAALGKDAEELGFLVR